MPVFIHAFLSPSPLASPKFALGGGRSRRRGGPGCVVAGCPRFGHSAELNTASESRMQIYAVPPFCQVLFFLIRLLGRKTLERSGGE